VRSDFGLKLDGVAPALKPGMEQRIDDIDRLTERVIACAIEVHRLRKHFELDLLVDKRLIVELKAIEKLHPVHQAQVITYLRLTGHPAGLLINFNETTLRAGLKRLDHPDRYARKHPAPAPK